MSGEDTTVEQAVEGLRYAHKRVTVNLPVELLEGVDAYKREARTLGIELTQSAALVSLVRKALAHLGCAWGAWDDYDA